MLEELDHIGFVSTKVWVLEGRSPAGDPYLVRRPSTGTIATFDLRSGAVLYGKDLEAIPVWMRMTLEPILGRE